MKNVVKFQQNLQVYLLKQDKFGTNCTVDKHTKISVKISVEICISADIQKVKYRPIISVDRYIDRSLVYTAFLH